MNPDRLLCVPESFTRRVSESFTRRESEKEEDLAGNVGENVAGWGTWAKRGTRPEVQGGHSQSKIMRNFRPGGTAEPRESPPTMTPNDLPPWTFKEDIERMSEAFPAEREGQHLCGITGSTKIGRG